MTNYMDAVLGIIHIHNTMTNYTDAVLGLLAWQHFPFTPRPPIHSPI